MFPVIPLLSILLATFLLLSPPFGGKKANALMAKAPVAELREKAGTILTGRVMKIRSQWNEEHTYIYTFVTISVEEYIKGAGQKEIVLKIPGGEAGGIRQVVSDAPQFKLNERAVLFMHPWRGDVLAGFQGKFTVKNGTVLENRMPFEAFVDAIRGGIENGSSDIESTLYIGEESSSYCTAGFDWTYQENPMGELYYVNPNTLDVADETQATINASSTWNEADACFAFSYGGTTSTSQKAWDEENVVFWSPRLSHPVIAEATYWYDPLTGDCLECDMEFNDNVIWQTDGGNYDIETVALHEFGHYLVLCHSDNPDAVMHTHYDGLKRNLHQDDINGIQSIYGVCAEQDIDITGVWTSDASGVFKDQFYPGERIKFHIMYDVMGDPATLYKIKAIVKAFGRFYYKTQRRYPGTGYYMRITEYDGHKIRVPRHIPVGAARTIVYKLKLKDGYVLLNQDKTVSQITVVAPP